MSEIKPPQGMVQIGVFIPGSMMNVENKIAEEEKLGNKCIQDGDHWLIFGVKKGRR